MNLLANLLIALTSIRHWKDLKAIGERLDHLALDSTPLPDTIHDFFGGTTA